MDEQNNSLAEIENEKLNIGDEKKPIDAKTITANRGRLIKKIKLLIEKLEAKENKTAEELEEIERLKETLSDELTKHKAQLKDRYRNEFISGNAKITGLATTLPTGISIQVQRVLNCIDEIRSAKKMSTKFKNGIKLLKETGLLLATPAIFTGKFIIEHWYVITLVLSIFPEVLELLTKAGGLIGKIAHKVLPYFKKDKDKDKNNNNENSNGKPETEIVPESMPELDPRMTDRLTPILPNFNNPLSDLSNKNTLPAPSGLQPSNAALGAAALGLAGYGIAHSVGGPPLYKDMFGSYSTMLH